VSDSPSYKALREVSPSTTQGNPLVISQHFPQHYAVLKPHHPHAALQFLIGCLEAGTWLAALLTIAGFFGRWNYWCDLVANFRWQYTAVFLVWGIVALVARRWRGVILGVVGLGVNLVLIAPWFWSPWQAAPEREPLRVVSWNMLLHNRQPEAALRQLELYDADLIFLMEVNVAWRDLIQSKFADRYFWRFAEREDNFGIAVLTRREADRIQMEYWGPDRLPSARVESEWEGRPFTAFFTHPPPPARSWLARSRDAQLMEVAEQVRQATQPVLVAGDFNATPWSWIYRDFEAKTDLQNAALGDGARSTWFPFKPWPLLGLPIDHLLVGPAWTVSRFEIGDPAGSDHCPLVVDLVWVEP